MRRALRARSCASARSRTRGARSALTVGDSSSEPRHGRLHRSGQGSRLRGNGNRPTRHDRLTARPWIMDERAMSRQLTLALVGCGALSLLHLPAIGSGARRTDITAVVDTDAERAEAMARETGARAFSSLED